MSSPLFGCRVRIQALNSLGAGPFSHTFKLKTKPLPPPPPRLECTAFSHQTLRLKWGDGPVKAATSDALQYHLQMEDKNGRCVFVCGCGCYLLCSMAQPYYTKLLIQRSVCVRSLYSTRACVFVFVGVCMFNFCSSSGY